jgi:hypothetical protein
MPEPRDVWENWDLGLSIVEHATVILGAVWGGSRVLLRLRQISEGTKERAEAEKRIARVQEDRLIFQTTGIKPAEGENPFARAAEYRAQMMFDAYASWKADHSSGKFRLFEQDRYKRWLLIALHYLEAVMMQAAQSGRLSDWETKIRNELRDHGGALNSINFDELENPSLLAIIRELRV